MSIVLDNLLKLLVNELVQLP